jgi:hypothetical protein
LYICSVFALQDYAMIRNRLFFAALAIAGLIAAQAVNAAPVVIINNGQSNSCTITPSGSTVFTISTEGNVLINGSYTSGACSTGNTTSGDPTFSPFSPATADLSVLPSSLLSAGGAVTPAFVVYYANTCTGKVTAGTGCAAVPAPWGTGGTVCSGQPNGKGQTYCSPSGSVTIPANTSLSTACNYTFQAINCTNGTTSVNSQTAAVTVNFGSGTTVPCNPSDPSDIGYTRQCSGSATNYRGTATWDNSYAGLFNGAWPGNAGQPGHSWTVTLNANSYAAFQITTGAVSAGVALPVNNSTGATGLMSISTNPGDFFSGTTICSAGSALSISSKPGTVALCKLAANSTYYMNISMASFFPPYTTTCTTSACATSWGFASYGN